MSFETINLIILICSFLALPVFIFWKIPALASLPTTAGKPSKTKFSLKLKNIISKLSPFSLEVFLQKAISKLRVLSLKTDRKTAVWLHKLRNKNQKSKLENGTYWEEVKKSKDNSQR